MTTAPASIGRPLLLLDMDEVLSDLIGAVIERSGLDDAAVRAIWPPGAWSPVMPDGRDFSRLFRDLYAPGFFRTLRPLPWMRVLWDAANAMAEVRIISATSGMPGADEDKRAWVVAHLGMTPDETKERVITVVRGQDKVRWADGRTILLDDREDTIDAFTAAGGHGILFPRLHNSRHADDVSVDHVARLPAVIDDLRSALRRAA